MSVCIVIYTWWRGTNVTATTTEIFLVHSKYSYIAYVAFVDDVGWLRARLVRLGLRCLFHHFNFQVLGSKISKLRLKWKSSIGHGFASYGQIWCKSAVGKLRKGHLVLVTKIYLAPRDSIVSKILWTFLPLDLYMCMCTEFGPRCDTIRRNPTFFQDSKFCSGVQKNISVLLTGLSYICNLPLPVVWNKTFVQELKKE